MKKNKIFHLYDGFNHYYVIAKSLETALKNADKFWAQTNETKSDYVRMEELDGLFMEIKEVNKK